MGWLAGLRGVDPDVELSAGAAAWWRAFVAAAPEAPFEVSPEVSVVAASEALPDLARTPAADDRKRVEESAPRVADGQDPRSPAPDGGEGLGQSHPDAWRHDRQHLNAQLTDGAPRVRPARTRRGRRLASPQAERREPRSGVGDAPQTAHEALVLAKADEMTGSGGDGLAIGAAVALQERSGTSQHSGRGPLAAATGERRFDTEHVGAPGDVVDVRAASPERRPGPIDLVAAGSPGPAPAASQRGPSDHPGAVPHVATGQAPSLHGSPAPVAQGPEVKLSTRELERARYEREIKRRAQAMLRFPRQLALELQQGEAIVRFTVGSDGALHGAVTVTKSAGFRQFDEEARSAVERAAPFPRMPEALVVHMRVAFENPVLR